MNEAKSLSIIVPVYNEGESIHKVIDSLKIEAARLNLPYEIITVNDGSTNRIKEILTLIPGLIVVNHPYNKGYGAALKSGISRAKYDWLLFFDGDGQHRPAHIKEFLAFTDEYDLIAGDRSKGKYVRPILRRPGLWLLKAVANYLVDYKIPDLNCGFRLVKKSALRPYLHLMPNSFSFSTTSTLAFLKDKRNVKFLPLEIDKRSYPNSTVQPKDALNTLILIFKIIMIFSPLRIFVPLSLCLVGIGLFFLIYDLISLNLSNTTTFIFLSAMLIFFFGLVGDQVASLRREIGFKQEK